MANGGSHDMVLEATTSCIVAGALVALALISYGLLIAAELLPGWLASSSSAINAF